MLVATHSGETMNKQQLKAVALSTALSAGALFGGAVQADETLNQILQVGQAKTLAAKKSQGAIDTIAGQTADLFQDFKIVNKEIEGLRVYNEQLERQIAKQLQVIEELEGSIEQVTIIERQIHPLILKMLDSLEQLVELDVPFSLQERRDRLEKLRESQMDVVGVSAAERFRQVLEAYKIEAEYGVRLKLTKTSCRLPVKSAK